MDNYVETGSIFLTQGLDDGFNSVDDPIGGHQVGLDDRNLVDVHGVVTLTKNKTNISVRVV